MKVTQDFQDMLHLFACGALGIAPSLQHNIDVTKLYKTALSQGIWHTVFLALSEVRESEFLSWGELNYEQLNFSVLQSAMINQKRLHNTRKLIKKLEAADIKCTVLKGETLAQLYKNPLCRISSDSDILIDKKLERKASLISKKAGMEVMTRNASSHHVVMKSEETGTVELHIHLYDEMFEDIWFDNKMANQEPTRVMKTHDGAKINTLGITDGAIFTALHMIKHFLEKGVGVRQMMDTLIYLKHYKNEIDFERFDNIMKYLKYDRFMNNIIGIGIEYFGFSKCDLPEAEYRDELMEKILDDAEIGGTFGHRSLGGQDFYITYTKARFDRFKNVDYDKYMTKVKIANYVKMLFPNQAVLKIKYPYVEKHKWLVPVAWIHRFLKKIFVKEKNITINTVDSEDVAKRLELVQELDMI